MTFGEMELVRSKNQTEDIMLYPEVKVRRYRSRLMFEFDLAGFDSIEVHCRRGKERGFTLLKKTSYRCYSDIRPDELSYTEIRHYKFYYWQEGVRFPEPLEMRIRTKGKFIFF